MQVWRPFAIIRIMHESTLSALDSMRPNLRKRWEALLRAEPVTSPLANPDSLVYLMDWTLDRVFNAIRSTSHRKRSRHRRPESEARPAEGCECGMNPLLAYFATAERTLLECVFLADSPLPAMTTGEREACAAEIQLSLNAVARQEIDTFCAVCQRRHCQTPAEVASAS